MEFIEAFSFSCEYLEWEDFRDILFAFLDDTMTALSPAIEAAE